MMSSSLQSQLNKFQPHENYCKLLELLIILLGGKLEYGIQFQYPCQMASGIYSIKMWLFCKQYKPLYQGDSCQKFLGLSYSQKIWHHMQEVSLFITKVYLKYWSESPAGNCAPKQDLALLCSLFEYLYTDIAKAGTTAFEHHLWYLSETLVAFGFFDDAVTIEEKCSMIVAL